MAMRLFALVVLVSIGFLDSEMAMAKMVLFSEVHGVVLQHGQPVSGAKVKRTYRWHWNDHQETQTARTDAQGRFHFPAATGRSMVASVLPHEPVITQEIYIHHDNKDYEAWLYNKHNYENNGELGRPLNLLCDLENPPDSTGEIYGICTVE